MVGFITAQVKMDGDGDGGWCGKVAGVLSGVAGAVNPIFGALGAVAGATCQ